MNLALRSTGIIQIGNNMFFKKKKPTPQAEAAPSAAKETVNKPTYPYNEALDWTVERMALKEKQAKAGWTAANYGVPISAGEHYLHCDRGEKGGLSLYRRAG